MNILLDTHIFLWWLNNDKLLTKRARSTIKNANEVYVSSASIWESAIKIKLGKLNADIDELTESIVNEGFIELPILARHAAFTLELPSHHRDPFDRMLVAQAIIEPLHLITSDKKLKIYSDLIDLV